jgi:hypothetical protein
VSYLPEASNPRIGQSALSSVKEILFSSLTTTEQRKAQTEWFGSADGSAAGREGKFGKIGADSVKIRSISSQIIYPKIEI